MLFLYIKFGIHISKHQLCTKLEDMASNLVTRVKWQGSYPGCFRFIFLQWEEVEAHCPSLFMAVVKRPLSVWIYQTQFCPCH